ncbi:MAG TPA: ADP-ribosylglycohydrolase family protein [Patescibacteria group bacterium]|nr:ADP-ribosylglycohydrolase family protein [Patescibacteria group bacterium]
MSPRSKAPPAATGIVDRARAAMFGVAVGDALGATIEFMTPAQIRDRSPTTRI